MEAGILVPITLFISSALMIVSIAYYRSRENLAMIERGMNPRTDIAKPSPYRYFKWATLLIGAGLGLLTAYFIDQLTTLRDSEAIYFGLIAIGSGLGLIVSHKAEKAWFEQQDQAKAEE
jgi:hypothetical protein